MTYDVRFIVVIRGRNCAKYVKKCLKSLIWQTHENWQAMVVLDAPEDGSEKIVDRYRNKDKRIHLYVNGERRGLCGNMIFSIKWANSILKPDDETVFAILDADDTLEVTALKRVARIYASSPKPLITYGSYIKMSVGRKTKISKAYPHRGDVRKLKWHGSHLKTIKWKVLKNIDDSWFAHNGGYLKAASDLALMFPCIELATLERCVHIPQVTYFWRDGTPHATDRKMQIKCERIIRAMKPLKPLEGI